MTDRAYILTSVYTSAARNDLIEIYGDCKKIDSVKALVRIATEARVDIETGERDFYRLRSAGLPAGPLNRRAKLVAWRLYVITRAVTY